MGKEIKLTIREHQVLQLIAKELNSKEIAQELYVSCNTILTHRKNILSKLQVRNIAGMVRVGFEMGLLSA